MILSAPGEKDLCEHVPATTEETAKRSYYGKDKGKVRSLPETRLKERE